MPDEENNTDLMEGGIVVNGKVHHREDCGRMKERRTTRTPRRPKDGLWTTGNDTCSVNLEHIYMLAIRCCGCSASKSESEPGSVSYQVAEIKTVPKVSVNCGMQVCCIY